MGKIVLFIHDVYVAKKTSIFYHIAVTGGIATMLTMSSIGALLPDFCN